MNTTDSKSCVPGRTKLNTTVSRWIRSAKPDLGSVRLLSDGSTVGEYEVRRLLGRGAYGEVYEVWHPVLSAAFALKIFSPSDREAVARLLTEVRALARIRHPNVIAIHQFGEHKGHPYFVMDLAERIGETLDEEDCRRFVADISSVLTEMHKVGIIHRDIKPANILKRDGRYLLADFGIVKSAATQLPPGLENPSLVSEGRQWIGTPGFIAPELMEGGIATPASDVFSLAATCLEICPDLRKDDCVRSVLCRALSAKPELRQKSVFEFASEFDGAFAERREMALGCAIILLVLAVVLWVWLRPSGNVSQSDVDVPRKLAEYAQEMTNIQQRIAMKNREIRGPLKGLNILNCTDAEEQIGVSDKVEAAQDRFFKETLADKKRYHELLKRSAQLKFNRGIPLTDAEAQAL